MPRYYCDYCDTYLTHDSPSVRKQHNAGYKHKANVRSYYQQFEEQQTQSLIDQRIKEHLGQTAAFQVGAAYNQHLLGQRPRLPVLPTPMMPPMQGLMRPPVLPRPMPGPPLGYLPMPPPAMAPPGQVNGVPRPPPIAALPPTSVPGSAPSSTMVPPSTYQPNPAPATTGGFDSYGNAPTTASEANH